MRRTRFMSLSERMRPVADLTTLNRSDKDMNRVLRMVTLLHGRRYR